MARERFWKASAEFEWAETGYYDLLEQEDDQTRTKLVEADELLSERPAKAFAVYLELSKSDSPTAYLLLGWCSEVGKGTPADLWEAMEWYFKSAEAGSWMGSLEYSRLLEKLGYVELAEENLEHGINVGLATAHTRQAMLRYNRNPTQESARAARPLLERAMELGHPEAEYRLWYLHGNWEIGLRELPQWFRQGMEMMNRYREEPANQSDTHDQRLGL